MTIKSFAMRLVAVLSLCSIYCITPAIADTNSASAPQMNQDTTSQNFNGSAADQNTDMDMPGGNYSQDNANSNDNIGNDQDSSAATNNPDMTPDTATGDDDY